MKKYSSSVLRKVTDNSFSHDLLAGLFAGIVGAVLVLSFEVIFRSYTGFAGDEMISPLTIFLGMPLLLLISGWIYFFMQRHIQGGRLWYELLCLLVTMGILIYCATLKGGLFQGMGALVSGISVITGLLAALLIPYLDHHPGIYEEKK